MDQKAVAKLPLAGGDLFAKMTVAAAVFCAIFVIGYLVRTTPPHDALGFLIGRDFVNTWMGARAALSGHTSFLFDFPVYLKHLHDTVGPLPAHNWSYPPTILLFVWPVGFLPYLPACAVWSAAGLLTYLAVASAEDRSPQNLFFLAVAPAVVVNLFAGQNGFFTAALLILFFRWMDRRPLLAGIALGLLTVKPQLFVLFPLMLLLSGRWRCFASAAATVLGLVALSTFFFGVDAWIAYFRLTAPFQNAVMNFADGIFISMMPTAFMNARLWGAAPELAWIVQVPFSILAIGAVVWTFRVRRDPLLSFAVLLTASFVVTPYAFDYDMVVMGWLIALLKPRFTAIWDQRLALFVWTLPATMILFGLCKLPVAAPAMAYFLVRLVILLRDETRRAAEPVALHVP